MKKVCVCKNENKAGFRNRDKTLCALPQRVLYHLPPLRSHLFSSSSSSSSSSPSPSLSSNSRDWRASRCATAVTMAAPFPLPSSETWKVMSHLGARRRTFAWSSSLKLRRGGKEGERAFIYLLNTLIVSRFGQKHQLNEYNAL